MLFDVSRNLIHRSREPLTKAAFRASASFHTADDAPKSGTGDAVKMSPFAENSEVAEGLRRRSLRLLAKHPVSLLAGPFQPGKSKRGATTFGKVTVTVAGHPRSVSDPAHPGHAYRAARNVLHADPTMRSMLMHLETGFVEGRGPWHTRIELTDKRSTFQPFMGNTLHICWNPRQSIMPARGKSLSPALLLGHEVAHAYNYAADPAKFLQRAGTDAGYMKNREEALVHALEVLAAPNLGVGIRRHYFEAAIFFSEDPTETVAAADAPWLAEKAALLGYTEPPINAFPIRSRPHVVAAMTKGVARLAPHLREEAEHYLEQAKQRELYSLLQCSETT